ncbi:beta-ketoacyl synthase chain length factor [Zooshikella harenae]|uniref:Beta-ketoacyl synthase chain length factor n=1 Tax=Zooshikella harenae TaxID=2827238 RepID=A0ABS5ZB17_9GAMM|nr:beta-ketoacyl synthase chain length factor [Zooshikella harenae]MBU2711251.1 beta-ketoacyl synthase chain length factor [Zooshikella harenae]
MLSISFRVNHWYVCAPEVEVGSHGNGWQENKQPFKTSNKQPDYSIIPAVYKRRLSSLGKLGLYVALKCLEDTPCKYMPCVFGSRHGDTQRMLQMLKDLRGQEYISPIHFSHSVYNGTAGILSILTKNTAAISAVSAGRSTLAAGFLEAWLQLTSQPEIDHVLFVYYDEPLTDMLTGFNDEKPFHGASAWVLSLPEYGQGQVISMKGVVANNTLKDELSQPEKFLNFWLTPKQKGISHTDGMMHWEWVKA